MQHAKVTPDEAAEMLGIFTHGSGPDKTAMRRAGDWLLAQRGGTESLHFECPLCGLKWAFHTQEQVGMIMIQEHFRLGHADQRGEGMYSIAEVDAAILATFREWYWHGAVDEDGGHFSRFRDRIAARLAALGQPAKVTKVGFICAAWRKVIEGPMDARRTLVTRCDLKEGHEGRHCDQVLLVDWDDADSEIEGRPRNEWKPSLAEQAMAVYCEFAPAIAPKPGSPSYKATLYGFERVVEMVKARGARCGMSRDTTKPKKPQKLIDARRERLRKFIELKAPETIVASAADLYLRSFKWSWRGWWFDFKMSWPQRWNWLIWLIDAEYRRMSRLCDEEDAAAADRLAREDAK